MNTLEQSKLNNPVYFTKETKDERGRDKLINKTVNIGSIKFGMPMHIAIHRNPATTDIMVVYDNLPQPNGYIYDKDGNPVRRVVSKNNKDDKIFKYWYGTAEVDGYKTPYLIQNKPPHTADLSTDLSHFELPPVLKGFGYDRIFSYDDKLIALIGDRPATFTDKYKRPLNFISLLNKQLYFPVALDKIATKFSQVAKQKVPFPAVVIINPEGRPIKYATIDLEPGYSDEDKQLADSFDAYYREDTPRGGKHYLVRTSDDSDAFKYRLTPKIEAQTRAQITFYGINGEFLNDDPEISDFSEYEAVGTNDSVVIDPHAPEGVDETIDQCRDLIAKMGTTGARQAKRVYLTDTDLSHADFMALLCLYRTDIKPLEEYIPKDMLPWVLAGYASTIIPGRVKHNTMRNGVPYLVYLATKIIYHKGVMLYNA